MTLRKGSKKVTNFSLIVVGKSRVIEGPSGSGKSTFINTLFDREIVPLKKAGSPTDSHSSKTMKIEAYSFESEDFGNKLLVTVVDTPGFGDNIRNSEQFDEIDRYVRQQFDHYLDEETRIKRNPRFQDTRLHALLYFIAPTRHGLKEIDIEFMKRMGKLVNIIPIIAKADAYTPQELAEFKQRINQDIAYHNIPIFRFDFEAEDASNEVREMETNLQKLMPFSVIGAEETMEIDGVPVRGRRYFWGVAKTDNPSHCDFTSLRSMLLDSHLQDLKDVTTDILYEDYRTERLTSQDFMGASNDSLRSVKSTEKFLQKELESKIKERIEIENKMEAGKYLDL